MKIKCFITGKSLNDTPEERVRQFFLKKLHNEYGYPNELIDIEFPIQRGAKKKHNEHADIVIFNSTKKKQDNIYLIVETKVPSVKTYDEQLSSYVTATTANWCAWTNGKHTFYFKTNIGTKNATKFTEIWDIPHYQHKLGSLKKEILIQPSNIIDIFQKILDYIYANANIKKPDRITTNIINILFCKLYDELTPAEFCKFHVRLNDKEETDIEKTVSEINVLFKEVKTKYKDIFYESDSIEFDKNTILEIVCKFQKYCFLNSNVDSIGTAFEVFTNESLKEDNGQFFTPRQVVKFMVEFIDPKVEELILDPACGSGGFLIESLKHISNAIDISLSKRLTPGKIITYKKDIFSKYFFGIDQERDLVKISNAYMAIVGDGSGSIFSENSLDFPKNWDSINKKEIALNNINIILTNPPFGKDIKVEGKQLEQFDLAKIWELKKDIFIKTNKSKTAVKPSILFLERCFQFLNKKNGRIGIVLPIGDLSNDEDANIKQWILSNTKILGIVQLPSETFQPYTGTQTCLLFLENKKDDSEYSVFMAQAGRVGKNQRGKDLYQRNSEGALIQDKYENFILDNDLVTIITDYKKYCADEKFKSNFSFIISSKELKKSLLPNFHNPKNKVLISKSKRTKIEYKPLGDLCTKIYTPPRTKRVYVEPQFGIPFLSGNHITQLIPQNVKYISKTETKQLDQFIVKEGDIVITRVGTMGIVRLIGKDIEGYAVSDNNNIIKVDINKIDPEYIYAILYSKIGKRSVKKIAKGSVQNYNTPKALKSILIPILVDPDCTDIVNNIKKSEEDRYNAVLFLTNADNIFNTYISD
ncbi:MAG: N-6 DNA methylase [Bacteroidia bacterium]|nr:N-6 DNA methylase [Bacteroidia bacterium]